MNIVDFAEYAKRRAARRTGATLVERLEAARQAIAERKGDGQRQQHSQGEAPLGASPQVQDTAEESSTGEQAPSA